MAALLMSEMHLSWSDTMAMPVEAGFEIMRAHRKNNEPNR